MVTRGGVSGELTAVLERYGAAVVHRTVGRPASGLGGPAALDNQWRITSPRPDGRTVTSDRNWSRVTAAVLDSTRLALPTPAVKRVDDALGELIWAPNLHEARSTFRRLTERWTPEQMTAALADVKLMVQRIPDQPEVSVFQPVLEFGAVGQASIVFDFASAADPDKPKVLLDAVGRLATHGQLNSPVPVASDPGLCRSVSVRLALPSSSPRNRSTSSVIDSCRR